MGAMRSQMSTFAVLFTALCTVTRLHLNDRHLGTKDCASLAERKAQVFHLGFEDLGPSANFMIRL